MKRQTFLTIVAMIASTIGIFALCFPGVLIEQVKMASPSAAANVMARTVGVLLLTVGLLNFLVRKHDNSPTMRSVLIANMILQACILPIDPIAYASGVFATPGSFVPNTILHLVLACGFGYYLWRDASAPT